MKVSDYKALFISEAREILQALEEGVLNLENGDDRVSCIEELFRNAHNMKGMSGAMGYDHVVEASHALENILDCWKKGGISIEASEIDVLLRAIDLLGTLVRWAIKEEEGPEGEELIGEILVLLSPINKRLLSYESCEIKNTNDEGAVRDSGDTGGITHVPVDNQIMKDSGDQTNSGKRGTCHSEITSTRVDLEKLDNLMDLVGELIVSRIRLGNIAHELGSRHLILELESSGKLISEIQKNVMEARLIPVGQVFHRFKRLVRDISKELGKKVEFETIGSEIGLDRTVIERMAEPLVHLIRNAVDHGIESPEERKASGKAETGKMTLSAERKRNHVIIEVKDDGRGIDVAKVKRKIEQEKPGESLDGDLSEDELCSALTMPGFSTRESVGRYSGRGVGMNVVKETVNSLGGSLKVLSKPGEGTVVSMRLPINLTIIRALLFHVGNEVHALPVEYVRETTRIEYGSLKTVRGREVYQIGDETIPVIRPDEIFNMQLGDDRLRFIKMIVVDTGMEVAGLVVDDIVGQQDVVIKGLPGMIRGTNGISGATILGSGMIAFIWDPGILFQGRCTYESNKETVVLED